MAVTTIRPNGEYRSQGITASAGTIWGAVSDENDATYLNCAAGSFNETVLHLAGPDPDFDSPIDLTSSERVLAARVNVRFSTIAPVDFFTNFFNRAGIDSLLNHYLNASTTPQDFIGRWITERPGGGEWQQEALNGMQIRLWDANRNPGKPKIYEAWVEVDVRTRVTVAVTDPVGTATTRRPTVRWTFTDPDGGTQVEYQIRVFTQEQTLESGFDPDLWPPVVDTGSVRGTNLLHPLASELQDGVYVFFVRAAKNHNGEPWYSAWDGGASTFDVSGKPSTPTGISPVDASTVDTDIPVLGATVVLNPLGGKSRVRWQLATNITFTDDLRIVEERVGQERDSGATTLVVPFATQLFQDTWYIRALQIDESGETGDWSAINSFTVSHAPTATGLVPSAGGTVEYRTSGAVFLSWVFTDTSPTDQQTAFDLEVQVEATSDILVATGKRESFASGYLASIPIQYKDVLLKWRVRVWDSDNVVGAFSGWENFVPRDIPVVNITSVDRTDPAPTVSWSFTASGGRTQASKRVLFTDEDGNSLFDSGVLVDAVHSYTPSIPVLENNRFFTATVIVVDTAGLTGQDNSSFETHYVGATAPDYTVNSSPFAASGYVTIDWSGSTVDSDFAGWRVYEMRDGDDDYQKIFETTDSSVDSYNDYLVGRNTRYIVTQVALRGGIYQESLFPSSPDLIIVETPDYALIYPADPSRNLTLYHVTADSFSDEIERATHNVVNLGRKEDIGDRLGYTGSLTAQIWDRDSETARSMRLEVERLIRDKLVVYLRSPFGDVWKVSTGNIQFTRSSGSGTRETGELTIPYSQLG